jgi:pyruvate/2-oxoglutarate dehydrogenase complex dihydrolipoamide acyltransferase (E2) component
MMTPIVLPKSGMGIDECTIIQWLKAEGDLVAQGEPLVEIETAKATETVEAPVSGRLSRILTPEGQAAAVNTQIGLIEEQNR